MAESITDNEAGAQFDMLMTRAGITLPPGRRAGYLVAYAELRAQLALLNKPLSPTVEPANVFRLPHREPGQ
jgi:hypothetical protein